MDACECPPQAGNETCELNAAPLSVACPTNGQTGKPVDSLTLKALVAIPLTRLTSNAYRFCRASDCLTVYYSPDGAHCFGEAELRERVYQKHPADDDMFVCYCFRHTVGDVRAALVEQRAGAILDAINAGIQAGQCACDIRNPQGSCCLGNVRALIQRLIAAPDAPAV